MTLPLGLGTVDWTDWVKGLLSSFIVGGSNAVTSGFAVSTVDGKDFAFGGNKSLELMGTVFVFSGVVNIFSFLRTNPLPKGKE